MSIVPQRKIVTVILDLNVALNRNCFYPIDLWFKANQVSVQQISYMTTEAAAARTYLIYCSLIPDNILGSFPAQSCTLSLNSKFHISDYINGSPNFQILEVADIITTKGTTPAVTTASTGKLALTLEFLRV